MSATQPEVALGALSESLAYVDRFAFAFGEIDIPIRCINSDRGSLNESYIRQYACDFTVAVMREVGHFPMLERPAEFNRLLDGIILELTEKFAKRR